VERDNEREFHFRQSVVAALAFSFKGLGSLVAIRAIALRQKALIVKRDGKAAAREVVKSDQRCCRKSIVCVDTHSLQQIFASQEVTEIRCLPFDIFSDFDGITYLVSS
jgi:K+-sensing histidine kinase KdpD